MKSFWEENSTPLKFKTLEENKTTDVLIVGGGIAGLMCAYKLKNAGADCILVEAERICGKVTAKTTAKVTLGHGLICHKMIKTFGKEKTKLYYQAQKRALEEYALLCGNIDCNFEHRDSYVYSLDNPTKIEKEISALKSVGVNAEFSYANELPLKVKGAVKFRNQAQIEPLKFLYSIAKDLPIYEHTKVLEFLPQKVVTNHGTINFKKLVVATHFPIINKHGGYFLRMHQHRSYVLALKGAQSIEGMYVDEKEKGLSFRGFGDLLLLGGGGHRTGKQGGCWQELEDFARKHYPRAEIVGKWATQDCMTLDAVPYIGQYSKATPHIYVATGFNKWGMTNAMVAADILKDLVGGKDNIFANVFSPYRSVFHPKLAINAFESAVGPLTPTTPRCPHLGCALRYNSAEHSWDCACHGSRFSEEGELLDNPATDDHKSIGG